MKIQFYKYQATGNDFILIDNRDYFFPAEAPDLVQQLCDRRFGIGADGLILIQDHTQADFEMVFFNPDASKSLCGNGSRCAVKFAARLGMITDNATFMAHDGLHRASISNGVINLKMNDVHSVRLLSDGIFVDTGSPHYVQFVADVKRFNVHREGKKIREGGLFGRSGTNVNFVELLNQDSIFVRTFERGVEAETLSCGTGVTASAIAASYKNLNSPVMINTRGGRLEVAFSRKNNNEFTDVYLKGAAEFVFDGTIDI